MTEYVNTPVDLGMEYEEKQFITSDDYYISAWHLLPMNGKDNGISVIISYGDMGNKSYKSYWMNHSYYLLYIGYDVWLYDYRGFGQSGEFVINLDDLYYTEFKNDLTGMVDMVKKEKPDNKIALMSFSLGCIVSMLYLNENPQSVDFYIGDGHVYSPDLITKRLEKKLRGPLLDFNFTNIYKKIEISFLIFKGTEDVIAPAEDMELLKKIKSNTRIITFEGGHLKSFMVLGGEYFITVHNFLNGEIQ